MMRIELNAYCRFENYVWKYMALINDDADLHNFTSINNKLNEPNVIEIKTV